MHQYHNCAITEQQLFADLHAPRHKYSKSQLSSGKSSLPPKLSKEQVAASNSFTVYNIDLDDRISSTNMSSYN